ncbi:MAG TPA: alanine dehydrogenase [Alphaproteobacteria bacterium]|nr:alanine dehydrogenase [Alphaproteobacteria bacterium]
MRIGVPKEIKSYEHRVGLTPASVREIKRAGDHQVLVQKDAATNIGFSDDAYRAAGAVIIDSAEEIFARADMIVKVKELQEKEFSLLREGQILFTYLHLAPDAAQTQALIKSGCIAVAYETVTDDRGGLPLLAPMSEVAGRMSIQAGAHCLEREQGGRGVLLGGVSGVPAAKVVVIGGGVVGTNAARMGIGLGADVTVLDKSARRLQFLEETYWPQLKTLFATADAIEESVASADLVIGAVLVPGARAPHVITRQMVHEMANGAVLVDVSIDQGGCSETSRPTTHANPTYLDEGVVHYCVTNMPGAVARTSTFALNNVTLPFAISIANKGISRAALDDRYLMAGINVFRGKITYKAVADAQGLAFTRAENALGA